MPTNAERFVDAYNRIDFVLEGETSDTEYTTFSSRVRKSKKLISSERDFLLDIGPLRNAIVHTRGSHTGHPIADPRDEIVDLIERQASRLEDPPQVYGALRPSKPTVLSSDGDIAEFLQLVAKYNFSQAPIRDANGDLSLITTNAVARWFASEYISATGVALDAAKICQVATFAEDGDRIAVRSKEFTVVAAWRLFAGLETELAPAALVLTQSGKASETPLAICARADVPAMLQAVMG